MTASPMRTLSLKFVVISSGLSGGLVTFRRVMSRPAARSAESTAAIAPSRRVNVGRSRSAIT
jgi:hypothetical protein